VTGLLCALLVGVGVPAEPALVDGVAAVVGRRVITRTEVETEGRIVLVNRAGSRGAAQPIDDAFRRSVLEYLVVQELLVQEARRQHGIVVAETEVDRGVATFKGRFADEAAFRRFLVDSGSDEEVVRTIVRRDLTVQRLVSRLLDKEGPRDDDVRRYLLAHPEFMAGSSTQTRERTAKEKLTRERREARFGAFVDELKRKQEVRIVARFEPTPAAD
jgi:hypothetical protein